MTLFADKMTNVSSFGNRKIGSIMSKDLLSACITVPNVQRIRDDDKVTDIVAYQRNELKERGKYNFFGVVNIHYCEETQIHYLVDGQHRYESIKILSNDCNVQVAIELVIVSTIEELSRNYSIINKNTPLPEFPDTIDKNVPETTATHFKTMYPSMWSKSSRARRPHIFFNYFQEALGVLCKQLEITNSDILLNLVVEYNNRLMGWDASGLPEHKNINDSMLFKCKDTGLYLGLYKHVSDDYRYDWVRDIIKEQTGKTMIKIKKVSKKNISKPLKTMVWNECVGTKYRNAFCICCNDKPIAIEDFHAGHIVAESNDGPTDASNLLPVCSPCNLSMGSTNMGDFIRKTFPNNVSRFNSRKCRTPNTGFISKLLS